ncbi:MAG: DUF4350 domain-containing protein [Egibacteraceae bacterium]
MTTDRRRALRRGVPLAVIAVAVLLAVAVAGAPAQDGPPLDPRVTGPVGTKGLVDVLAALDVEVRVTDEVEADDAIALLLTDDLDEDGAASLRRWVRDGGTLVVADPASTFAPEIVGTTSLGPLQTSLPRGCEAVALRDVDRVSARGGAVYESAAGDLACFPRAGGHWLVAASEGAGTVVAIGGAGAFTNRGLGEADNGVLAAALLAPAAGGSVAFLRPAAPGEGEASLGDLVPDPVRFALVQLLVAFLVVVAWRARRLGDPVREPQPVQVAGSELVVAVGNLLQQTGARGQAARLLRDDLRRDLADRLGLPADSPPDAVAAAVARRTGRRPEDLIALLTGAEPAGEAGLVVLAAELERARRAALDETTPTKEPARVR